MARQPKLNVLARIVLIAPPAGTTFALQRGAARQGQSRMVDLGSSQRGCCSARRTPRGQSLRSRQGRWAGVRFSSPSERRVAVRYGLMRHGCNDHFGRIERPRGADGRSDKCWT